MSASPQRRSKPSGPIVAASSSSAYCAKSAAARSGVYGSSALDAVLLALLAFAVAESRDALLLAVADLLVSDDVRRVRACPGHDCGWLFLDPSGRRRWCQMAVCGNRAKQARIRERNHSAGSTV